MASSMFEHQEHSVKPPQCLPAATLLQSSNQAYQHGVSGPFWYAAGATIQIILFGILAVQIKMKAPSAHTVLEIVHARWRNGGHLVFFFFCFLTNIIVSAMLILGGAAVMTALTGMNTVAVSAAALAQAQLCSPLSQGIQTSCILTHGCPPHFLICCLPWWLCCVPCKALLVTASCCTSSVPGSAALAGKCS